MGGGSWFLRHKKAEGGSWFLGHEGGVSGSPEMKVPLT